MTSFEQNPFTPDRDLLINELIIRAKNNEFDPKQLNPLTALALKELAESENFAKPEKHYFRDLVKNEKSFNEILNTLSWYTQTIAKEAYLKIVTRTNQDLAEFQATEGIEPDDETTRYIFWQAYLQKLKFFIEHKLEKKPSEDDLRKAA